MGIEQNDRFTSCQVPHPRRGIPPGRDKSLAIGVPGQGRDAVRVAEQAADRPATAEVPKMDCLVFARRRQLPSIGTERKRTYGLAMRAEFTDERFAARIPEA